ncbi:zinc ribbon domain-containing protein [uncultured Thiodictyon sp.]|uniref:zinc ribbon domain-containing protein n=2 Tax=uncultured Thiodictyon sp. TaxID=1846217 RepID=UPI0025F89C9E|nr:zinc ribbon domain-containing protein [uncultured Thiodictyon sp.]
MSMQCPKCGAEQPTDNLICARCGIVFAKYYKYHPRRGEEAPAPPPAPVQRARAPSVHHQAPDPEWPDSLILPARPSGDWLSLGAHATLWAVLLVWGLTLMLASVESGAVGGSFLHLVNLPFHEFGHILFRPFGHWIMSLGGTLGQLLMPAICCGVLLIQTRDPFGAAVSLWWFGENFLDIAPYINDARAGVLPLVGGNFGESSPYGFHDWEYLLGETGLLDLDHRLAQSSRVVGCLVMVLALAWGAWLLARQFGYLNRQD